MRRVALLGFALALVTHLHGHWLFLDRLDTTRTLRAPLPPAADPIAPPAPAARVTVVLVDGLRDDVGDAVPELRALAARGARRIVRSEWPSYTHPNVHAMVTGVPPRYSGVRLNSGKPNAPHDTLGEVLARAGRRVAVDDGGWPQIARWVSPRSTVTPDGDLSWRYFGDVDRAGHAHGAASPEYHDAALRAGQLAAAVAAQLGPRDVLIVVADHGHRARGGHGGREPEVTAAYFLAVGGPIRRGVTLPEARTRDLAPTLAMLLGAAPPRDSLGAPLVDLLDASDAERARLTAPAIVQRARAESRDPDPLAARLAAGDGDALAPALAALTADDRARDADYCAALRARRWLRLLAFAALALSALAARRRHRAPPLAARDFLPWAIYAALFLAGTFALGYPLGWSIPRGYLRFLVETALVGGASGALAVAAGRRLWPARRPEQAATAGWLIALYLGLAAAAGLDPAWLETPALGWAVIFGATSLFWLGIALALSAIFVGRPTAADVGH
jgi:hypothetical protein